VVHVLRSILAETDLIIAGDGYPILADLTRDSLSPVPWPGPDTAGVMPTCLGRSDRRPEPT
jgi:hypothetical protein